MKEYSPDIIIDLDNYLDTYDKVYLLLNEVYPGERGSNNPRLANRFIHYCLTMVDVGHIMVMSSIGCPSGTTGNVDYRQLTKQEEDALLDLYHLYDFSDNFYMIGMEQGYGGLLNFVKNGVMTLDEVWEAVLR